MNIPIVVIKGIVGFGGNEAVALYRIQVGRSIGSRPSSPTATTPDRRPDLLACRRRASACGYYPLADPLVGLHQRGHPRRPPAEGLADARAGLMDAVDRTWWTRSRGVCSASQRPDDRADPGGAGSATGLRNISP